MEANAAEDCPLMNDFGEVMTPEKDVPKHVRRNGYVKASVVGVMGILVFFGLVATYKFRGDVFIGNADADVALEERISNAAVLKKGLALQSRGDLFGGDKCPGYAGQVYSNNVILDYRAPMKGTELVGYYKGIPQLCESMKKWDVYDLSGFKIRTYAKGSSRMVASFTWVPTLKSGKKAAKMETEVGAFQVAASRCTRQDLMYGNWQNLDSISGASPATDNGPRIGYMLKMIKSWRTGKFHGSSCFTYFKNHFIPTLVVDARAPIKAPGISVLAVGMKAMCAWFASFEAYKFKNIKDNVYTKGGAIVQSQAFSVSKGGGKAISDGNAAMVNFDTGRVSYYDNFYFNAQSLDSLR
jgi:hypothetical protein